MILRLFLNVCSSISSSYHAHFSTFISGVKILDVWDCFSNGYLHYIAIQQNIYCWTYNNISILTLHRTIHIFIMANKHTDTHSHTNTHKSHMLAPEFVFVKFSWYINKLSCTLHNFIVGSEAWWSITPVLLA